MVDAAWDLVVISSGEEQGKEKRYMWRLPILVAGLLAVGLVGGHARAEISKGAAMAKVSPDLAVVYDEYRSYQAQGDGGVFTPRNP